MAAVANRKRSAGLQAARSGLGRAVHCTGGKRTAGRPDTAARHSRRHSHCKVRRAAVWPARRGGEKWSLARRPSRLQRLSPSTLQPALQDCAKIWRAAARVLSISASVWAAETKPASKAEGASEWPASSMAWKKRLKALLSHSITSA